jgi:Putative beta-barrel porin 2
MMFHTRIVRACSALLFVVAALLYAVPAHAQTSAGSLTEGGPDPNRVHVRIGALWVDPSVSLTNLGVDTNVFNEPPDESPKQDFTLTVIPAVDLWLGIGRTWLSGSVRETITWFQTYASERSATGAYAVGWKAPLNRLVIDVGFAYARPKDRPGYEIDTRAERQELSYKGSVEIRALPKTLFGVRASRKSTDYAPEDTYNGVNLEQSLNLVTTEVGGTVRHQLTPLTSLSFVGSHSEDRFEFSPDRDSNSNIATATVTFDPSALIRGSATVGYRDFQPLSPGLASYEGLITSADLVYVWRGSTRFEFLALRDVEYSYDVTQPYYLESGFDGSVAQQIYGPLDLIARGGLHHLAYRDQAGAAVEFVDRVDTIKSYGGGLGYHLGDNSRVGFDLNKVIRDSELADHRYNGLRFGVSFTYNF